MGVLQDNNNNKMAESIDITQLPIPQLNQLNQQLEQEIEVLTNSLSQLKVLQGKFTESQESLNTIKPENKDTDILVPLTGSMYVKGQLEDTEKVIIDIGTGYYVEKSIQGAKEYFKRRVEYLTKQMEKVQPVVQEKYRMKQAVMEILQLKVQNQIAQQQQQKV